MQRRGFNVAKILTWGCMALPWGCLTLSAGTSAQSLPPDVRAGHWAATQVQVALRNHILTVEADKGFHGDTKVTHLQALIALAGLARALEGGTWQGSATIPVTVAKTGVAPKKGAWESQAVSRYVFATVLTRMGDYAQAGLIRAKPNEKALGKSTVIPPPVAVTIPKTSPAYASLSYLASHRMIGLGSVLLFPDDKPLQATEMSRALRELVTGLNDRLTDLGQDEDGSTNDQAFHPKPATKKG
jgi:hypothetical protein